MKATFLIVLFSALHTSVLLAQNITHYLLEEEIALAVQLADRYHVPLIVHGPCTTTEYKVSNTVRGFNPAVWQLHIEETQYKLSDSEISGLIDIHDRLKIPAEFVDSVTLRSVVTITGKSCGLSPNVWSISY